MMPASLPRIGRAVICNGKSAAKNVEKRKTTSVAGNSAPPIKFRFETGWFVCHLNVFQAESFKLRTLFPSSNTNWQTANLQHARCNDKNVILNDNNKRGAGTLVLRCHHSVKMKAVMCHFYVTYASYVTYVII